MNQTTKSHNRFKPLNLEKIVMVQLHSLVKGRSIVLQPLQYLTNDKHFNGSLQRLNLRYWGAEYWDSNDNYTQCSEVVVICSEK